MTIACFNFLLAPSVAPVRPIAVWVLNVHSNSSLRTVALLSGPGSLGAVCLLFPGLAAAALSADGSELERGLAPAVAHHTASVLVVCGSV